MKKVMNVLLVVLTLIVVITLAATEKTVVADYNNEKGFAVVEDSYSLWSNTTTLKVRFIDAKLNELIIYDGTEYVLVRTWLGGYCLKDTTKPKEYITVRHIEYLSDIYIN